MIPAKTDDLARDEILYLPIALIHPDPEQPRLDVDADLAASIKAHGVLQAIQVRPHPSLADQFQIVDGERRFNGARKAGLRTIPATFAIDVEDPADRIIRQIVRNEGKPLTPVEEALAFKRAIDGKRAGGNKRYGMVQLAHDLGYAKSTVGDRLTLTELPKFWLDLIVHGPLQASHAPILYKYRLVPEDFQRKVLEKMKDDYIWPSQKRSLGLGKDPVISIDDFEDVAERCFSDFLKPVSEVPGYKGPTAVLKVRGHWNAVKCAVDPQIWQPLVNAAKAKKAKKTRDANAGRGKARKVAVPAWAKVPAAAKTETSSGSFYNIEDWKGVHGLVDESGKWHFNGRYYNDVPKPFDPAVLLKQLDPAKIVRLQVGPTSYSSAKFYIGTTDNGAFGAARKAYIDAQMAAWQKVIAEFASDLLKASREEGVDVEGGLTPDLLGFMIDSVGRDELDQLLEDLLSIAIAQNAPGASEVSETEKARRSYFASLDREPAERLLTAVALIQRCNIKVPSERLGAWEKAQLAKYSKVKITWPSTKGSAAPVAKEQAAPVDAEGDDVDETEEEEEGELVGVGAEEE